VKKRHKQLTRPIRLIELRVDCSHKALSAHANGRSVVDAQHGWRVMLARLQSNAA
jgi:hypothetical protein